MASGILCVLFVKPFVLAVKKPDFKYFPQVFAEENSPVHQFTSSPVLLIDTFLLTLKPDIFRLQ
jgi:hypothetical protein